MNNKLNLLKTQLEALSIQYPEFNELSSQVKQELLKVCARIDEDYQHKIHMAQLESKAAQQKAELKRAEHKRAELQRVNLLRAELQRAELLRAELQRAELQRAELQRAEHHRQVHSSNHSAQNRCHHHENQGISVGDVAAGAAAVIIGAMLI